MSSGSAFTPRAIARLEIAPRTNIYASFSQGFRSGVFQNQVLPNPALVQPIKPERITAYEVGLKLSRPRLQFDVAAFYYDYSQLQVGVTVPNPITGVGVINTIINAKAAELYGADAQLTFRPFAGLNVSGSVSLIHARYTDFRNATATGFNAATGLNVTNQSQDWSGHQMARAPSSSATLQADYSFDFLHGRLRTAVNGTYSASYVVSNPSLYGPLAGAALADKQRFRQGAYGLGNAQLSWTDASKHYTLTAYLNNFTDKRFKLVTSGGAFGDYRQFSQPRTIGGRIGYAF